VHITLVKKRLANGEPCEKCAQTEEMLKRRGYWDRIDDVVWALEGDPDSPGNLIGARHGIKVAPFFVLRDDDGAETALTSPLKLIRDHFVDPVQVDSSKAGAARPEASDWRAAAKALSHAEPAEILRFALETWGDRCPIAFGGAEEIVLIDMATRLGLPFRVVTVDTGRLHAETYAYLDDVRRRYGVSIEAYLPDTTALTTFLREKGLNSFYRDGHRECCGIRKIAPLGRALAGCEAWVTGRRRDQGPPARADLDVFAMDPRHSGPGGPLVKVNPLAAWTHDQLWGYIRRHDVPCNPLHEQRYTSIGCEPCTRPTRPDQHPRAGRWWWESEGDRESGAHVGGDGI
jgi:phosphoadenosine phosphosulfate reductase